MTNRLADSRPLAVLLVLGGVWGSSFLFIKVIVDEISPIELVAGRLFLGTLAVSAVMLVRRLPLPLQPALLAHVSLTALISNVIPFALISWGEERIGSGVASVLNSMMPIFTAVIAAAVLPDERFTPARLGGLVLGFLGVMILIGDDVLNVTDSNVLGQLAVVGAAVCYAVGAVYMRILLRSQDPISLSGLQVIMGTIMSIPLVLTLEGVPHYSLSLEATLSLLALGVFGTGFGYIAYLWLIESVGSVRASLVTYVIPIIGLFLGWVVLDEHIGLNTVLGAALIVVGVASVMRGQAPAPRQKAAAPSPAIAD